MTATSDSFDGEDFKGVGPPSSNAPVAIPERKPEVSARKLRALFDIVINTFKFHMNKASHATSFNNAATAHAVINRADSLEYYVGRNQKGVLHGGNPHHNYLSNLFDRRADKNQKHAQLLGSIAKLPANVSFEFKISPTMEKDRDIVSAAFTKAGFSRIARKTYVYSGDPANSDPLPALKSDMRRQVKLAERDLEVTTMNVEEFFAFYKANLVAAKKPSNFFLDIDKEVIEQLVVMENSPVDIIAVRRKMAEDDKAPHPIDAAIAFGRSDDGHYKMMRITYRHKDPAHPEQAPHPHATKLVMIEAMRQANRLGLKLDSDGATEGGSAHYGRFGKDVFKEVQHDVFKRTTLHEIVRKFI